MKSATIVQFLKQLGQTLRQASLWYFLTVSATVIVGALSYAVWHQFGADQTIPASSLATAHGLAIINLGLSLATLEREPFASSLLVGTTFIYEMLVILFLYLV